MVEQKKWQIQNNIEINKKLNDSKSELVLGENFMKKYLKRIQIRLG